MSEIVLEVISVHHVVVNEGTSVLVLGLKVESDIVPVHRPNFVVGMLRVSEVLRNGQGKGTGVIHGHLALKVLILASVVVCVSVLDADPGSLEHVVGCLNGLLQSKCRDNASVIHF